MTLLDLQRAFRAQIAATDEAGPPDTPGMGVYRNGYRGRLLAALETTFERTRRWTGPEPFAAAARHYVLNRPPTSWTLDLYGVDFPALLETLFADNPEAADLAWFELGLQRAYAAPDAPTLEAATLAEAGYADDDWDRMTFELAAGFGQRAARTDCIALWSRLADAPGDAAVAPAPIPEGRVLVWRGGETTRFRWAEAEEAAALDRLGRGEGFAVLAAEVDGARLGGWLGRWLGEGLLARAIVSRSR